ncbi:MAG: peroxidase family protein [Saprospiraceae bacterium]
MDKLYTVAKIATFIIASLFFSQSAFAQFNRTIDGTGNNPFFPDYGKSGVQMNREGNETSYTNGSIMVNRGVSPREVSNLLCSQTADKPSATNLSAFVFSFLQFIDHDITLVEGGVEAAPMTVPVGDHYFDPFNTGTAIIPFTRSLPMEGTGTSTANPRQHKNLISTWIDASNVYGSDQERADWLRSGVHGKLKVSHSAHGDLLPVNTFSGLFDDVIDPSAPFMDHNRDRCGELVKVFVAGDVRANEQPTLLALHTLFVREHNRICDERVAEGYTDDEDNYQYARKIVGGLCQSILYQEVLPALGMNLGVNSRYNVYAKPDILNEFATAAFRLGHTMIVSNLRFEDQAGNPVEIQSGCGEGTDGVFGGTECQITCGNQTLSTPLALRDAFFNPSLIANNGFENLFWGLSRQKQQEIDLEIVDEVRNFLFGQPGSGGLDLAATNIQRGRDHGLPDFNTMRTLFGMRPYRNFSEITQNVTLQAALMEAYGDINNIDAWIGFLAEDHLPGASIGPSLEKVMSHQFKLLRDCDKFWFDRDYRIPYQVRKEIAKTTLSDVIKRNTYNLFEIQDDVFHVEEETEPVTCNMLENPSFETSLDGWSFTHNPSLDVTATMDGGTCFINIEKTNNRFADIMLEQNLPLERGKSYLLSFKAKSNSSKVLLLRLMQDHNQFIPQWQSSAVVRNNWKDFGPYVIRATRDMDVAALQFCFGIRDADVWLDDIEFKEVGCDEVQGRQEQSFVLSAFQNNEGSYLNWTPFQSEKLIAYDVLRSKDGNQWNKIASLNAANDLEDFIDNQPLAGGNFYKIRAIDEDYLEAYSNVVFLNYASNETVNVYPNPVVDYFEISYAPQLNGQMAEIQLVDAYGRILQQSESLLDGFPIPMYLNQPSGGILYVKIKPENNAPISIPIHQVRP